MSASAPGSDDADGFGSVTPDFLRSIILQALAQSGQCRSGWKSDVAEGFGRLLTQVGRRIPESLHETLHGGRTDGAEGVTGVSAHVFRLVT